MPLQTDQQQLGSVDLGCNLAAYFWGRVGSGQRCCWPLNADPLDGRCNEVGLSEIIQTDRLLLRPFSQSDAPAVFAYSQDSDWGEYQQTTPASEQEAERVVAEMLLRDWESEPVWAILRSGDVLGLVSLVFSAEHRIVLLGYGIHREHRGLGLTGEAIQTVLTEAFAVHEQLTKVTANTDARNHSSSRLLEKLGFTHEGTLRSGAVTAKGELVDGAIYGLLRSEWQVDEQ
jgi:RimJ/RimL family protein N-acetyltransferase